MSGGIVLRAPRKMIIVKAVPRQMLATITAGIGNDPSQSTGLAPSELRKTWLSEAKKKSYIATHRNPAIGVVDEEREREAEAELPDHRGAHNEHDGVADHSPEVRIGQQPRVVVDSYEAWVRRVDADEREVRETGIERPQGGTDKEKGQERCGRHDSGDVRGVPPDHVQRIGRAAEWRRTCLRSAVPRLLLDDLVRADRLLQVRGILLRGVVPARVAVRDAA